ncbi:MAG: sigma-70 family RNA polymerase sigma factor, partial [Burkholderiales bacterium]|nr:sigma-70 family RNA polymerase sigma factor [Opitutaceae bacterium]
MHRSSPSDNDLLHAYATAGDQTAFAELVRRHGGLVYAAARRQHDGDHHRAEETTQRVFVELAKQASTLARHPALVAWLHQHTRWSASHLRQAEARRRERETATHEDPSMQLTSDEITPAWDQLAPLLDEAVAGLGETDRAALILRHFEGRSFAEVGEALGVSESAAQMRTARALEKLRSALARKGLVAGSAALAAVLASQAAPPLPATVANTVLQSVAALSAGGVLVGGSLVGVGFFSMQIVKISAVALVAAALVGGYVWLRPGAPATASTSSAPISETSSLTSSAALLPAATSARPGPDEWLDGFRKLFGLSQTELKARLAALGMPLSDRALERTLHHDSPERFMESLLGQLALFHPDRLLTHAIRQGADSAGAITLVDMIDKTWRRTRLESWTLGEPVVALMRTAFADDAALMENLDQLKRPYGSPRNLDPVARGAEVLRLPSGKRSEALMQLALDWPAERAREMAAWGKAHLKGKEREEFFSRLAYPAYASANPELAA